MAMHQRPWGRAAAGTELCSIHLGLDVGLREHCLEEEKAAACPPGAPQLAGDHGSASVWWTSPAHLILFLLTVFPSLQEKLYDSLGCKGE